MFRHLVPSVRLLTADDLDIGVRATAARNRASSAPDTPDITAEHPRIQEIIRLADIYGGVILSGAPGTSKSFFAGAAADVLTGHVTKRFAFVQFHQSYQYSDFMLGFEPTSTGFKFKPGVFLRLVERANEDRDHKYVLVIDELSRADVGRVFGEALTYIEFSKRELDFEIANGWKIKVPNNLVIIATMNPFDRGVDEVDAAFERRFAKISMEPDRELLNDLLTDNDMDDTLKYRVISWFDRINRLANTNPAAAVGHAYFAEVSDEASLQDLWNYQLKYLVQRAFRRDANTRAEVEANWKRIFQAPTSPDEATTQPSAEAEGAQ